MNLRLIGGVPLPLTTPLALVGGLARVGGVPLGGVVPLCTLPLPLPLPRYEFKVRIRTNRRLLKFLQELLLVEYLVPCYRKIKCHFFVSSKITIWIIFIKIAKLII